MSATANPSGLSIERVGVGVDATGVPTLDVQVHATAPSEATRVAFAYTTKWQQLSTSSAFANHIDCGIAEMDSDFDGSIQVGEVLDIGKVTEVGDASVGDRLTVDGARSGRRDVSDPELVHAVLALEVRVSRSEPA